MIDLAWFNIYFLGAALVIGIASARWAFPRNAAPPEPGQEQEDESRS